jgi:hypothetical protein
MSFSSFLAYQANNPNWTTLLTTPTFDEDVPLPHKESTDIFTSPIIPQGYYAFTLTYQILTSPGDVLTYYSVYVFTQAGMNPIEFPTGLQYKQTGNGNTEPSGNVSSINNVISGIYYSNGTETSQINISAIVYTDSSTPAFWASPGDSDASPCLCLYKLAQ